MSGPSDYLARQAALVGEETVLSGGARVRMLTAGSVQPSVVLLVTGAGRGARADTSLLLPLLARRHRVAALELADLDDPWADGPYAVSAALDALGGAEAVVVGHALGASVALAAADTEPRVRALALVAGWLHPTARLLGTARLWALLADSREARDEAARLLALRSPGSGSPWDQNAERMLTASARADASAAAARLRIPALVVGCTSDAVVGSEGSEALLGAIEDARYAVVDSGHAVLAERPAELLAVLEHFLADPRRDPAGSVLPRMTI
ncbi:alpha/beta fold hydrolase [Rathayibacter agropyri]|uniref:alpha/beta fold hydrolase n=1 Tax=Rathayibacter agropyri TaxID=1634927 RepID=UPI00156476F1|nr:alpha/beta hydrolase [Rathayibacter agropyri]NRD08332.1 alpha/beta hydrolase [Rathayibacter agropyri]